MSNTARADSYRSMEWIAMREARWAAAAIRGRAPAVGQSTYDGCVVTCTVIARAGCPKGVVVFDLNGQRVSREHLRRRLDAMTRAQIAENVQEAREWRREPLSYRMQAPRASDAVQRRVEAGPWR